MASDVQLTTQRVGRRPRDAVLACLAIGTAVLGCFGYFGPISVGGMLGDRDWIGLHLYDGRLRGFWIGSTDTPVTIEHQADRTRFSIHGRLSLSVAPPVVPVRIDWGWLPCRTWVRIGDRRAVPPFGAAWRSEQKWYNPGGPPLSSPVRITFFRIPFLIPVVLLLILPVRACFGAVRFRMRHRKNECVTCGYDLRGTPSLRCPECGTVAPIACAFCGYDLRGSVSESCPECGGAGRRSL
jgi:predicted RNA-binding Zn-ribbon protein involved in translation (DUF1610 family)